MVVRPGCRPAAIHGRRDAGAFHRFVEPAKAGTGDAEWRGSLRQRPLLGLCAPADVRGCSSEPRCHARKHVLDAAYSDGLWEACTAPSPMSFAERPLVAPADPFPRLGGRRGTEGPHQPLGTPPGPPGSAKLGSIREATQHEDPDACQSRYWPALPIGGGRAGTAGA